VCSNEVQLYVHLQVHKEVHIVDLLQVAHVVMVLRQEHRQLLRQEVTALLQGQVVLRVTVDHLQVVLLEEVIQVEVQAGVPVGVVAGVVVRNNYILR